jgi:hypothetical protein
MPVFRQTWWPFYAPRPPAVATRSSATVLAAAACVVTLTAPAATAVTGTQTLAATANVITLTAPPASTSAPIIVTPAAAAITLTAPVPTLVVGTVTLPAGVNVITFIAPSATTPGQSQFEAWLAEISTGRIILCELQPAEALSGWTVVGGGSPQTYRIAWSSLIAFGSDAAPVYRRIDGVKQDDADLVSRASIAQVQANLGSWFFDETTSLLYISTSSGVHPDTFAAVAAYFTLFVATEPADFVGGQLYEPRLTGELPTITAGAEDPFTPIKPVIQGLIDVINAHAFFDAPADAYVWRNKTARLFLGGGDLPRASYQLIAVCQIDFMAVSDTVARFGVRSSASVLEKNLPVSTLTAAEYPRLGDGLEGTYKPILVGQKRNIPGICVDSYVKGTPSFPAGVAGYQDIYLVADAAVQSLFAVTDVRAVNRSSGVVNGLSVGTHYTVNLGACTVTVVTDAYRSDQWDIRIDAIGQPDGSGGYLRTFGQIAKRTLLLLGESSANIDAASFAEADVKAPYDLGLWLRDPQQGAAVLALLQQSVIGNVFMGTDGRWRAYVLDAADDPDPIAELEDADIVTWQPVERIDPIYPIVRCYFDEDPASGEFRLTTAQQDRARFLYQTDDGLTVNTLILDASAAQLIAQRYRLLSVSPDHQFDVDLRGLELMTANPYNRVLVTRDRAPGGSYVQKRMEILAYTKPLSPPAVRVRLGDISGISDLIGHVRNWAPSGGADTYALSTPTEQEELMYWGDDNDEVAPGVENQSIWW